MYFIAHFAVPKMHVIVPKTWVMGIENHWEKFINNSINKNQKFLCFYSERPEAMNQGKPNAGFVPDFNLGLNHVFPADGCYIANLVLYKGNINLPYKKNELLVEKI